MINLFSVTLALLSLPFSANVVEYFHLFLFFSSTLKKGEGVVEDKNLMKEH